jgi:cellulose synthase/poly-beta-1,6-N-acetylglucosamine synthase-like glycosyltransferase
MMLDSLAWALAAIPALLLAVLAVELALGVAARTGNGPPRAPSRRRAVILMPAHNEAGGIVATIERLHPALDDATALLVVADNCSDDTAARARQAGARVIERHDADRRGKGHALAFGREHLRADPPDCVVVLDADCEIGRDDLHRLIDAACAAQRPVQSCYLLRSHGDDGAMTQISNFALLIKNRVRQRGAAALGAPALLVGTGMAFPWPLIAPAPLATSHLVEDLVLGIDFTRKGQAPLYLEAAMTWSDAASQQDTLTQRTRWEHGYIQTALRHGLPLFAEGLARLRPGRAWFGLSLLVPPLALLMSLALLALAASALLALAGATAGPALLLAALLALTALLLGLAWARDGHATVSAATLGRIPLYILWKIPVYLRLVRKRETEWVRTRRKGE